jgi:hypothetical protein
MDKLQLFFEYLVENPGAFRILGMILSTLLLLPYIIIWLKASQVNRIRKAYDELITDQTTTITTLYRNIMDVQGNLAQTRGELDQKIAELKNKKINLDQALLEISDLKGKINVLEQIEIGLMTKLKTYEGVS